MSDLDKMAAEYMGWQYAGPITDPASGRKYYYCADEYGNIFYNSWDRPEWSPSTNIIHARRMLDVLQEKGVNVDITLTHIDTVYVELSHPNWGFVVSDENQLLEKAITKACIMAFWVMEDD